MPRDDCLFPNIPGLNLLALEKKNPAEACSDERSDSTNTSSTCSESGPTVSTSSSGGNSLVLQPLENVSGGEKESNCNPHNIIPEKRRFVTKQERNQFFQKGFKVVGRMRRASRRDKEWKRPGSPASVLLEKRCLPPLLIHRRPFDINFAFKPPLRPGDRGYRGRKYPSGSNSEDNNQRCEPNSLATKQLPPLSDSKLGFDIFAASRRSLGELQAEENRVLSDESDAQRKQDQALTKSDVDTKLSVRPSCGFRPSQI